jgi:magnesium-transporting ATPase (P-type)/membrane-associated phospholipid phosphatase
MATHAGPANALLAVLAAVLAIIGGAAWWIGARPEEFRSFFVHERPWLTRFRTRYRKQIDFLLRRLHPEGASGLSLTVGLLLLAAAGAAFGGLLQDVIGKDEVATFDAPILRWIVAHRTPWLTTTMRAVSLLGNGIFVAVVVVGVGLLFLWRTHRWRPLFIFAISAVGAELISLAVQHLVGRPPPPAALTAIPAHGFGFPSGYAARAAAYGALAYMAARVLNRWESKVRVWAIAIVVTLLLGTSRVYLGVNWLTDVLGGWAIAAGWLAIVITTTSTIDKLKGGAVAPASEPGATSSTSIPELSTAAVPETGPSGLSEAEVRERVARGEINKAEHKSSRSLAQIVRSNVFTRFNALLGGLVVVILLTGSARDALFAVVLVANIVIGIVQEVRAKRTLDRLELLAAPRARVVRGGNISEIPVDQVVLGDLLDLHSGDQIAVDGSVRASENLELDESLLTGESEPAVKQAGDEVLSGSFVVAGSGRVQATRVGANSYARKLAAEGRRFQLARSELRTGINRIIAYVTWAIIPTAVLLLVSQLRNHANRTDAIRGSVAAVVGMVPEGLVLLASLAMALAAVRLGRRKVLVQELPAVEGLARVDVLCLDKTGTITDGTVTFERLELIQGRGRSPDEQDVRAALGALGASETTPNASLGAIAAAFPKPDDDGWGPVATVAFSSARKWSAVAFESHGTWVLGAPEIVLAKLDPANPARAHADQLAATGRRVVVLAQTKKPLVKSGNDSDLPGDLVPAALVILAEQIRPDAAEAIRYFAEQGVALKVISGDSPKTVGAVASSVGIAGADDPRDARTLPEDAEELAGVLEQASVFGRVVPQQKRAMIAALKRRGHVVAMTGDGVNDVLALKDADLGIAMGSGTAATRAVAQVVLLGNDFAALPGVVAEGRRLIANIERTASLFVTKTIYVFLLAISVGVVGVPFPFLPRHLTLAGSLTIGIPAFLLALVPNTTRARPGFIARVLRLAVPAGASIAAATLAVYAAARALEPSRLDVARTAATIALTAGGWSLLMLLTRGTRRERLILGIGVPSALGGVLAIPGFRRFFALEIPPLTVMLSIAAVAIAVHALMTASSRASAGRADHDQGNVEKRVADGEGERDG